MVQVNSEYLAFRQLNVQGTLLNTSGVNFDLHEANGGEKQTRPIWLMIKGAVLALDAGSPCMGMANEGFDFS